MSAPAGEVVRELERDLLVASESGETRTFAELQDTYGLGHEDLAAALDTLREHGKAVEAAPGEWRGPMADELGSGPPAGAGESADGAGPVVVSVGEGEPEDERPPARWLSESAQVQPTVRLTMAIADALEPQSLGALVKAGIEEARGDGVPFWLEVV